eukprot:7817347-Alexandrium_andersonii.AAC.1
MKVSEPGVRQPGLRKVPPTYGPGGHAAPPHPPLVELLEGVLQEDGRAARSPGSVGAQPLAEPDPPLQRGQQMVRARRADIRVEAR